MTTVTEGRESNVIAIDTKSKKLGRKGNKLTRLALLVEKITSTSTMTQREIADAVGFKNQNMITMIKQGDAKLPIDRAPAMARVLGVDPLQFLDMTLEQYFEPAALADIRAILSSSVTTEEREVLEIIRAGAKNGKPLNAERLTAIRELFT